MLELTWTKTSNPALLQINCLALQWAYLIDIPIGVDPTYYVNHSDVTPEMDRIELGDDNQIVWGPSLGDDNWCTQDGTITGKYSVDLSGSGQLDMPLVPFEALHGMEIDPDVTGGYHYLVDNFYWEGNMASGRYRTYTRSGLTFEEEGFSGGESYTLTRETVTIVVGGYVIHHQRWWEGTKIEDWTDTYEWWDPIEAKTKGFSPDIYASNYYALTRYVRGYFREHIAPKLRYGVHEWVASLDAVQGYHPYDINMIESLASFNWRGDILPLDVSEQVVSILDSAVSSRGGLLSPKGLLSAAQIFSNVYLYYKYVALGNFSDISEICLGTDKPFLADTVNQIVSADPDYRPSTENQKLMQLAQLIVHRGGKKLSSYGTDSESTFTHLGDLRYLCRARLRAYPKYLDDMSTASIICEELGLSLTAERLTAIIPYEFMVEWFAPVEETIRSVEYNADRLGMMYEVENLCLSHKTIIELEDHYLKARFGLSDATGHLKFKAYSRHSQEDFPPTAPDLSLRPSITLSRVMQGSSLVITRL